jgi:hypothetical protein
MLNLTLQMLKLFAEGGLPATTVQKLAHAAWQDGWGHGDDLAVKLKGVGSSGTQPGNALRDLLRVTKHLGIGTPEPYLVKVKAAGGEDREVAVFLPHEQVPLAIGRAGLDAYRLSAEAWDSGSGLAELMRAWGDSPEVAMDTRDVLAIGLHADGVCYTANQRPGATKSVLAAAWNIISAESPANRGRRHLFFALAKSLVCDCGCEGQCNVNALLSVAFEESEVVQPTRHVGQGGSVLLPPGDVACHDQTLGVTTSSSEA